MTPFAFCGSALQNHVHTDTHTVGRVRKHDRSESAHSLAPSDARCGPVSHRRGERRRGIARPAVVQAADQVLMVLDWVRHSYLSQSPSPHLPRQLPSAPLFTVSRGHRRRVARGACHRARVDTHHVWTGLPARCGSYCSKELNDACVPTLAGERMCDLRTRGARAGSQATGGGGWGRRQGERTRSATHCRASSNMAPRACAPPPISGSTRTSGSLVMSTVTGARTCCDTSTHKGSLWQRDSATGTSCVWRRWESGLVAVLFAWRVASERSRGWVCPSLFLPNHPRVLRAAVSLAAMVLPCGPACPASCAC